ncbi:amino acid ABC transporter permease [Bosea sp. (in: a-proteobacteria)]|uniref:amino acid ABC transporter permease n=1 Tax=Bosea sp. (in: a-proteobacteria) TaxID=1871050 RepID=UPI00261E2BA7|nr:amino acid ABC transporter permease [Bosea sp. (in: a-proteobacteria)]MCO5089818.1 amino acid ABC transporter permease [Bosea sp. (in: a-proteobacteria)]
MFSLDIWNYWEELAWGVYSTLMLSLAAMLLGLVVAILCALIRTAGHGLLNRIVSIYVEVIRNTPFLVQIFLVYFGLPTLGIRFSPTGAALLALVLNVGAYCTEIVRAGIESIHKGQIEAGKSLGLSNLKIFFLIIIPPAIQNIYPALTGQFILSMLSTSVLSAISAEELTSIAGDIQSRNFRTTEVYITVLILYYLITLVCMGLFALVARWAFPSRYAKGMR